MVCECGHSKMMHWITPTPRHGGCIAEHIGQRCVCTGWRPRAN